MAYPDIKIGSSLDAKGFKQAETATAKLEKSVKKLAGAFGLAFSTRAVVNFSKTAVKAFAEDDAAITALRQNLKNLGLAYQSQNAENFIATLERQTNILDDELRPAYAKLSKITLSTTKTQELMALAVDVARANGLEFSDVINTLSRAYVGNYKGLKQLNTGLTDAELATKDFAEIQAILIKQSTGANKAYIDTFAGSIDKLAVASANAKEIIGEGLVDLFADMAGNGDIEKATGNVITLATAVSDFLKDLDKYSALDYLGVFLTGSITQETFDKLEKRPSARRFFTGGSGVSSDLLAARKAQADALAKLKADKAAAAAKIKADKLAAANKAKLDKAAAVFEIQKIQIAAALKGKISEEEKVRLLLMQAIEDENADKAEALAKKLEEIQAKNAKIAADLLKIGETKDPFATWAGSLSLALIELGKLGLGLADVPGLVPGVNFNPNQNKDRNYDMKVAAVEAAVALSTIEKDPALTSSIFSEDDTITDILIKVENAAADAAAAAEAAATSVTQSQTTVDALAAAAINVTPGQSATGSSSMFNPYGPSVGGPGYGMQTPSITINIEGNVLDGDDFTEKVNDALLNANRQGLPRTAAGFLVDAG